MSTSTEYSDYYGDFVEWGNNAIGSYAAGTWITLSADQWQYLFGHEEDANTPGTYITGTVRENRFGLGTYNGVKGMILLPDDASIAGFKPFDTQTYNEHSYTSNTYSDNTWNQAYTDAGCRPAGRYTCRLWNCLWRLRDL